MRRILIVDDTDHWRERLAEILRNAGYLTIEAESGESALQLMQSASCDLILMDLLMPQLNGIETACRLRACPGCESVPIILLTNTELNGDCTDPPAPYVDGYIDKKDVFDSLLECMRLHLGTEGIQC